MAFSAFACATPRCRRLQPSICVASLMCCTSWCQEIMSTCVADARLRLACSLHLGGRALDALARQQRFARNKPRFEGRSLLLQHQRAAASPPREKRASHRTAGFAADAHQEFAVAPLATLNEHAGCRPKYMARSKQRCEEYDARRAYPFPSSYPPHEVLDMQRMLRAYGDARAEWNRSTQCEHAWRVVLHRGTARRCDKSRA